MIEGVNFAGSDLTQCDFRDAVFEACSLRDVEVSEARFEGADLRGADLGGVKMGDAARFRGAMISRSQAADLLGQLGLIVG